MFDDYLFGFLILALSFLVAAPLAYSLWLDRVLSDEVDDDND